MANVQIEKASSQMVLCGNKLADLLALSISKTKVSDCFLRLK